MNIVHINNLARFYEINSGNTHSQWAFRNFREACKECTKLKRKLHIKYSTEITCPHIKAARQETLETLHKAMDLLDTVNPAYTTQLLTYGFLWLSQAARVVLFMAENEQRTEEYQDSIRVLFTKLGKFDEENLQELGLEFSDMVSLSQYFNKKL